MIFHPRRPVGALLAWVALAGCAGNSFRDPLLRLIHDPGAEDAAILAAIDRGGDLAVTEGGFSALDVASDPPRAAVLRRLLQRGANVNADSALQCRALNLLAEHYRKTPYFEASFIEIANLFLDAGVNLAGDNCDTTAFSGAVRARDPELMDRMLDAGATVDIDDSVAQVADEANPALFDRALRAARVLVEHGASVEAPLHRDEQDKGEAPSSPLVGSTPFVIATLRGNAALRAYLVKHGATSGGYSSTYLASRCALFESCITVHRCPAPSAGAPAWICDPEVDGSVYVCIRDDPNKPACRLEVDVTTPAVALPSMYMLDLGNPQYNLFVANELMLEVHELLGPLENMTAILDNGEHLAADLGEWGAAHVDAAKLMAEVKKALRGGDADVASLGLAPGPAAIVASRLASLGALGRYLRTVEATREPVLRKLQATFAKGIARHAKVRRDRLWLTNYFADYAARETEAAREAIAGQMDRVKTARERIAAILEH